jgi:uncharacterized protein
MQGAAMKQLAPDFKDKYGPWALIAGASDGTGRAFAHQVAASGINCVIISRRQAVLDELATEIRSKHGVECVPVAIDLSTPDAFDQTLAAVGDREIGLLISNAGSDPNGSQFLDKSIDAWLDLVRRNVVNNMRTVHHFASLMRQRRRGGLLLVGSAAGYGGSKMMAVYSATKAFVWCLAESLWLEHKPHNVDVLYIALAATDTPFLTNLLEEKGQPPMKRAHPPGLVAEKGLTNLHNGPVYDMFRLIGLRGKWRGARVRLISRLSNRTFGE